MIIASFQADIWYAYLAGTTLVLGASYTLVARQARDLLGQLRTRTSRHLKDLNAREFIVLGVLAVAVLLLGFGRRHCSTAMHGTVEHLVEQITTSKLGI